MAHVYEEHPELYHYTNFAGFRGIVSTNTLWATHFRHLNDSTEVVHLKTLLTRQLHPIVKSILLKNQRESLKFRRRMLKDGGIPRVADQQTKAVVDTFYEVTFEGQGDGHPPFADPYVSCFCTHTRADDYTQENGLLSQWRGYAGGGGLALIFDTRRMCDLLEVEAGKFQFIGKLFIGDAIYDHEEGRFVEEFGRLFTALEKFVVALAESEDKAVVPAIPVLEPLLQSAPRFKHRAFFEEQEVRLVMFPMGAERLAVNMQHPEFDPRENRDPLKPVHYREMSGNRVPYVIFNEGRDCSPLPLKKVIVGPQRDQKARADEIKVLLSQYDFAQVEVVSSETPFVQW